MFLCPREEHIFLDEHVPTSVSWRWCPDAAPWLSPTPLFQQGPLGTSGTQAADGRGWIPSWNQIDAWKRLLLLANQRRLRIFKLKAKTGFSSVPMRNADTYVWRNRKTKTGRKETNHPTAAFLKLALRDTDFISDVLLGTAAELVFALAQWGVRSPATDEDTEAG